MLTGNPRPNVRTLIVRLWILKFDSGNSVLQFSVDVRILMTGQSEHQFLFLTLPKKNWEIKFLKIITTR